jgi:CHAD domain-containing protein
MAYRLKLDEPMDTGFRRILAEQIDRAIIRIEAGAADDAVTSVHEARKCLKRARALLRFVRPLLDNAAFKAMNGTLRDVGRALSGTRDLDVLGLTLADLRASRALKATVLQRLEAELAAARAESAAVAGVGQVTAEVRQALVAQLRAVVAGVPDVAIAASEDRLATGGLAACLADCRKSFRHAFETGDGEAFHEWRKSVQLHWRHMQLVQRAWPDYAHARIEEARALSALLGSDRDLDLLQAFAASRSLPRTMLRQVADMVESRQQGLRTAAKARGKRLLAEGTTGFCRRLASYWTVARELRPASKDEVKP